MADKINVAVVGCGARAQTAHLPYLKKNQYVNIAALCDRDEAKLAALRERYETARIVATYNEVLKDDSIDAVIITTPTYLHHPMVMAGLDYGKHVFVELPMGIDEDQIKEMIEHATSKNRILAVAHNDHSHAAAYGTQGSREVNLRQDRLAALRTEMESCWLEARSSDLGRWSFPHPWGSAYRSRTFRSR
jgi:ornithine cyclodeaminase/alanine dehydrogenase-like protein (mu-crystallin family)